MNTTRQKPRYRFRFFVDGWERLWVKVLPINFDALMKSNKDWANRVPSMQASGDGYSYLYNQETGEKRGKPYRPALTSERGVTSRIIPALDSVTVSGVSSGRYTYRVFYSSKIGGRGCRIEYANNAAAADIQARRWFELFGYGDEVIEQIDQV